MDKASSLFNPSTTRKALSVISDNTFILYPGYTLSLSAIYMHAHTDICKHSYIIELNSMQSPNKVAAHVCTHVLH